ncbi:FAD-binding oxidoreductase [Candidatus Chloroploca sp. Khr17]|uniref:FAD-binding oxidoreductase n=1 Tax=Candidatus Chloroploca sp. Khr17 TaxID=2496869 RepID=UPI00101CFDC7|nr:FAD-binding oxidoreductase [Candidatus Chloroploca sp. Khr17]
MHTQAFNTMFDADALDGLRAAMSGELIAPDHPGYEQTRRVWNGQIDRRPAVIVQVRSTDDAALALQFARRHALPVSVRGGGHNTAGLAVADGGLMIDLTLMKDVHIDANTRVARAGAGLTIGELVPALAAHGLTTPTGTCAGTGISGSTIGGGIGWLSPKHGLGVDNVVAFELVTADGRTRRASTDEHPDLFWALRGGGGNFGVVTTIEYRLHPLGQILGGMLVYPLGDARSAMKHYSDLLASAPDALGSLAVLATFPNVGPALMLQFCYTGDDLAAGEALLAPLRTHDAVALDTIQAMPYSEFFMAYTPPVPDGLCYHDTACALPAMSDSVIDALIASAAQFSSPRSSVVINSLRGVAARIAPEATAFALRTPHLMVVNAATWEGEPGDEHIAWAEEAQRTLRPLACAGLYVNFMGEGAPDEVRAAYAGNYERLSALKAEYDPHNVFRRNQNILPAKQRGL